MSKRLIPFRWLPGSWGLVGDAFLKAEAHYLFNGPALERRLLEIRLQHQPEQLALEMLDIDARCGMISRYDAAVRRVELTHPPGVERDLALLDIEHTHGKIEEMPYQKQRAALNNEPWICIVNSGFDPKQGIDGVFFEFDWNRQWIEFLRSHGYHGHTDEQVIDEWFSDVCRSHQMHESVVPFSIRE